MPIIEVKDVSFVYGKGTPFERCALSGVNISINKGEFIGVIGHTGSGKSTLMQLLNGLIRPSVGQVLIDGRDIWLSPKKICEIRFKVGLVFQYPEQQLFDETVYKDIGFGPRNMGLSQGEIDKRIRKAAQFVGLDESLFLRSPFELSGGEKRRAAIAGVVAMDPEVLVLDEPTSGLDPRGRELLLAQMKDYHKKRSNTVLLVSHNMEDIAKVCDRVLVLSKGQVVLFDMASTVFSKGQELESLGLKVPQVTNIMTAVKESGAGVASGVLTVDDAVEELLKVIVKGETSSKC